MLAALLSILIGICSFISFFMYSAFIIESPDFDVSASPHIAGVTGGQNTIDVEIEDMHKINKVKAYKHTIELGAICPECPESTEIMFDKPQVELNGKPNITAKLNYRINEILKNGTYTIKIVAIGDDNLERTCNFYLQKT